MLCSLDINKPVQRYGTYQIVSAQSGLVPQEKGSMTRSRIWGANAFVDDVTRWVKVHLIQYKSDYYTLEAKEAFGRDCMTRNVVPRHYHADSGLFAENTFKQDCESKM